MSRPEACTRLTAEDWEVIDSVETYLGQGRQVYQWWEKSRREGYEGFDYKRYDLLYQLNRPGSNFGFTSEIEIDGSPQRLLGTVQEILYDTPKSTELEEEAARRAHAEEDPLDRVQGELREFMMRHFMNVADFYQPQVVPDSQLNPPGLLSISQELLDLFFRNRTIFLRSLYEMSPFSWSQGGASKRGGWGYTQLYFKRWEDGCVGKFSAAERDRIIDVREVGAEGGSFVRTEGEQQITLPVKYEWVVFRVKILDMAVSLPPFTAGAQLKVPVQQEAHVVLHPDFIIDETSAGSETEAEPDQRRARFGWGYAFVKVPSPDRFLAYGPRGLGPGFMQFRFDLLPDGAIRLYNFFAANQPSKFLDIPLNPLEWGLRLSELGSWEYLTGFIKDVRRRFSLPFKRFSFDPIFMSFDLINLLTGGRASKELGISKEQFLREIMAIHFMDAYQFALGTIQTWSQIDSWSDPESLPPWVHLPDWVDSKEYPFRCAGPSSVRPNFVQVTDKKMSMHFVDEGPEDGEVLLMSHGNPDWSFSYRHLIKDFSGEGEDPTSQEGYRCVAVDHIGFGLSDKPPDWDYLPSSHAKNFEDLVERLGLKNITLIVNDWGGPIALPYAIRHPENIRALVIMNTSMWSVAKDWKMRLFSGALGGPIGRVLIGGYNLMTNIFMPNLLVNPSARSKVMIRNYSATTQSIPERKGQWVLPKEIIGSGKWLEEQFSQIDKLAGIPSLVIWGMQDPVFGLAECRRWQKALPQSRLVEIADAKHYPHEDRPALVINAVRRLLEETDKQRGKARPN